MNMKRFLLSILCCLMAVVSGYTQGSDDFAAYFTKTNTNYTSGKTEAGWEYTYAAIVSIDKTYAPTINGKRTTKGTITSPTLSGGCGTLSLKYAYTYSESKGVSFKVTIKQGGADVASYYVENTTATQNTVYEWKQDVNVQGDFVIYITNNSPSNSTSNKDRYSIWNIEWTAYGQASVPQLDAPVFTPSSCTFTTETFDVSIAAEEDATIYYTLDGSDPTENSDEYDGVITLTETTTIKAIAIKAGYENSDVVEETYTKKEIIEGQVEDIITIDLIGETGNSYTSWSDKRSNSTAVYAGQSISNTDNIQLRSDKDKNTGNYSGIVTTTSGGKVKKVIVEWNSATTNNTRELNVYCSNNPYSTPNDLYADATNGELIGSIIRSGATELSIDGDYQYVGLRSKSGAMYINSITIIWETEEPTSDVWGSLYSSYAVEIPENVKVYIVTGENNGYVRLVNITGAVPAKTGVIYNGVWNNKETATSDVADVTGNLLKGSDRDTYVTEEAFVLAKVDGVVGFYKAQMNQLEGTAFLNNAYKAYLPASALTASAQGASGFKFRFDNQTTGIEGAPALNTAKAIYDLSGRKVNDITTPGLYIVNGKKVMVK